MASTVTLTVEEVAALIVARARIAPEMTALAVGDEGGTLAIHLARTVGSSGHLTVIDPDTAHLSVVVERARALGLANLTVRVAVPHELPFPDGAFDRIAGLFAHHGPEFVPALRECRRVLKPGGCAAIAWLGERSIRPAEELTRAGFTAIEEERRANVAIAVGSRPGKLAFCPGSS